MNLQLLEGVVGPPKIQTSFVTSVSGLAIPSGTLIQEGTSLESILKQLLTGSSVTKTAHVVIWWGQSNDSGLSPRTGLPVMYSATDARVRSFDFTSNTISTYQIGSNDHAITQALVPSYDNGFGPEVGYVHAWKNDTSNIGKELFVFKKDLTPPVSTNAATIAYWNSDLYPKFLSEWNAFKTLMTSLGYVIHVDAVFCGLGEGDGDHNNANYLADLTALHNRFKTDTIYSNDTIIYLAKKQPAQYAAIAAKQSQYVANNVGSHLIELSNPTFLGDGVHYSQDAMLRLGALEYSTFKANNNPIVSNDGFTYDIPIDLS